MNWTLLVPGALLPANLAPELVRAIEAPRLVRRLASARLVADPAAETGPFAAATTPHWSWLARAFGVNSIAPVTGPYAWQAAAIPEVHRNPIANRVTAGKLWVARCDPIHMAIARDHFVVHGLGNAPLQAHEAQALLAQANAALRDITAHEAAPPEDGPALRLATRGGRWFLLSDQPLALRTVDLDRVLGQSVQDCLPSGADARRWRQLANEIQMLWHTNSVNIDRENAGAPVVNALWIHGGGYWRPLEGVPRVRLLAAPGSNEALTVRGWMQAGGHGDTPPGDGPPARKTRRQTTPTPSGELRDGDTLAIHRDLFEPFAQQDWESWLNQLVQLQERIEHDLQEARDKGALRFDLVLCGATQTRTLRLPLQLPWWQRWQRATRDPGALLRRWLVASEASEVVSDRPAAASAANSAGPAVAVPATSQIADTAAGSGALADPDRGPDAGYAVGPAPTVEDAPRPQP